MSADAKHEYDTKKYVNGMFALKKAVTLLQEHFAWVEIKCAYLDKDGVQVNTTIEWEEEIDPDDKE